MKRLLNALRSLLTGTEQTENGTRANFTSAIEKLNQIRGGRVSPQPAERGTLPHENVAAAARDYGQSRLSGETDALGDASGGYRSAR